jgi:Flp pilus assembly protein TadG
VTRPQLVIPKRGAGENSRKSAGQSLVEFALLAPVFVFILLMTVDLGRAYFGLVNLTNVARVGANFAAANPQGWQGSGDANKAARYVELMRADATKLECTLPVSLPAPQFTTTGAQYDLGSSVTVTLSCSFRLLTPMVSKLIGDGAGNVTLRVSSTFKIRSGSVAGIAIGGNAPSPTPSATSGPTSPPTPTPVPTVTPTPDPLATPGPSPSPTPVPVVVDFYGDPTSTDSSGGGAGGDQIVGVPTLTVTYHNTTTGGSGSCLWTFGDGGTSTSCSSTVSHSYFSRSTYTVSLSVDGSSKTRTDYVVAACQVPAFAGVRKNEAPNTWQNAGFNFANLTVMDGGNYKIGYQSLVGGLVNPSGGCSGATIQVGP